KHGLQRNHAYSLLGVYDVTSDKTGKNHRLLKLRNPWSQGGWSGKWSNNDHSNWTPKLRAELKIEKNSDSAVFVMELADMFNFFKGIDVCKLQKGWTSIRLPDTFGAPAQPLFTSQFMYEVTVP